VFCLLQ
jgi:hypothetical protein